ncbi:MAG TPA: thioredoxin-disulfide reductase [Clostridium sp.]|uniref:Thioredoxin reductase n=2 Tax=Acetivibrio mesophilus TaxID=2487273 RepID=A0A4Q0I3S1_9FIRM|nr:thioredoxin-disulfide reductase [Clostridium sp. Bc-iso-3]RXE58896.1 thioredoxin-disulfide reductase [Acetivibrio mesophilus]HHV28445.1 thioredoxin-disulfide reductase [Clostridium sp.]
MDDIIFKSTLESFDKDVLKSDIPVAVLFYTENCPACDSFVPIFERTAERYSKHIKFVKIYRQQNRQLAESLRVKSSPTVLFYKEGNEVCDRLNGYISKPEFTGSIEKVVGNVCKKAKREKVYCDFLIMGGGPAGLSAAIYAARAKLHTVVVDEGLIGGQVATTFHVANYPGTNGVVRGVDLMENMKKQAVDFGAHIDDLKEISDINLEGKEKIIITENTDYYAKAVLIATGATPRRLQADGEREFRGRGVHYCATCDGALYHDANVLVVGGGESATEEAVFLTRYAKHVTIVNKHDYFRASKTARDEVLKNPNISVMWDSEVRKVNGDNFVKSVIIENIKTGKVEELDMDGLFVYIGMQPKTELFMGKVGMNEQGYITTNEDMATNIPGVFAAGDVREKKIRQIVTAVGDGAIAGIMAERYINEK